MSNASLPPRWDERVHLFPGYAAKRAEKHRSQFAIDLFVSGYASKVSAPGTGSSLRKALIGLAKCFVDIPKAEVDGFIAGGEFESNIALLPSTPGLPMRPSIASSSREEIHSRVEARLRAFSATFLPDRDIRLSIFASNYVDDVLLAPSALRPGPLIVKKVKTDANGFFECRFKIPAAQIWHNRLLDWAAGDIPSERQLVVKAELVPPPVSLSRPSALRSFSTSNLLSMKSAAQKRAPARSSSDVVLPPSGGLPSPLAQARLITPITSARVRVISDVDDTIKRTDIVLGIKAMYHSVFVREAEDLIIPGMAEWYTAMSRRGVYFHYVSNSAYQLLPEIQEFLRVAELPEGSIKLKYYGAKSMVKEIWTAAGKRKRQGILEILDTFPNSQFFLVGDSGQADLELYTTIARERPKQVLAIFIRDVWSVTPPIAPSNDWCLVSEVDPITLSPLPERRPELPEIEEMSPFTPSFLDGQGSHQGPWGTILGSPEASRGDFEDNFSHFLHLPALSDIQTEDQTKFAKRLDAARSSIPPHIPLRFFGEPKECIESFDILDSMALWDRFE